MGPLVPDGVLLVLLLADFLVEIAMVNTTVYRRGADQLGSHDAQSWADEAYFSASWDWSFTYSADRTCNSWAISQSYSESSGWQ